MTEWSSVFGPKKLSCCQVLNRFLAETTCSYVFTRPRHWSLCWSTHFNVLPSDPFSYCLHCVIGFSTETAGLSSSMIRHILCLTQSPMRWISVVGAWSWSFTPIELRNEECWSHTSSLPYPSLTWFLSRKRHNFAFSPCLWLHVVSYLQVLQLRFRTHLPPFLQLRHAIINTFLSFELVTRDCYNG
jgi:hypothetical protein